MAALVAVGIASGVGAEELARVTKVAAGEVGVAGFAVEGAGEVEVEAVVRVAGLSEVSEAWVLAAGSREVVWRTGEGKPAGQARRSSRYRERVRLAAGSYEVYYALEEGAGGSGDAVEGALAHILGAEGSGGEDLGVWVRGSGRGLSEEEVVRRRERVRAGALVDLAGLGDGVWEARGFVLGAPAEVEVYALGELGPEHASDVGWIVDAASREVVWELTWAGSEPAGGDERNRVARARVALPAGRYEARFVTDRGHSAAGWFGAPRDPAFWGLTVHCAGGGCGAAAAIDGAGPGALAIGELTGLGDRERRELELTLDRPARLWLYAVGEGTGEMYDRAWIEDAATGQPVWTMEYERTRPAGGNGKNRLADETVVLPAGRYKAVAETDDSHSAGGGWNAEPPAEPERWGLTIFAPVGGMVP